MSLVKTLLIVVLASVSTMALATPKIQHWTTANGARVYYIGAPELPMVDVRVVFDAGSARDGKLPGLALLTNGLLDSGIKGQDEEALAAHFEDLGAQYSASALRDMALVQLRSLSDEKLLVPALQTFSQIVSTPQFPSAVLRRERERLLVGLKAKQESAGDLASDAFYAALYPQHAYGRPTEGTADSLKAISTTQLGEFHRRYYVASNSVIAIVGAVDRQRAEAIAEQLSAPLARGRVASSLPTVPPLEQAVEQRIKHASSQSHILVGQTGMVRGDADYMALYVGNHILGGSGFGSRIMSEIREKRGLAYSAYSYFLPMRQHGPFMLGLQTRNDQVGTAQQVLMQTLSEFVSQGPTRQELNASKKNITGGFPLRIDSNKDLVEYAAMIGFYGLPLDYLDSFNRQVEAVTVEQIRDAFQRRIKPEQMVTVIVGNG
ncbi:MAG: insulinase family protein [Gammaproteobacteria bacterium]|nr:insulinase family protein [Gammaproteobacteria bacterium]